MRASALAICLLVVLLAAGAAEASWTCNGITLYDAPTGDSGWQDYESAGYVIGRYRVITSPGYARAIVQAYGGSTLTGTYFGGTFGTGCLARLMAVVNLSWVQQYPKEPRTPRPTVWPQTADNHASYRFTLTTEGIPSPTWEAQWDGTAFASYQWYADSPTWTWDESDNLYMPPKEGSLHAHGQLCSLAVGEHCVDWVRAHAQIAFTMNEGKVRADSEVWADWWTATCSGCP